MGNKNKQFTYTVYGIMEENKEGNIIEVPKQLTTKGQKIKPHHTFTINKKEYAVQKIAKTGELTYNLYLAEKQEKNNSEATEGKITLDSISVLEDSSI